MEVQVKRLTTCLKLLQRSLILGSFSDYIHCMYVGMGVM